LIVLDIETTGVNPQVHGIVSIGAIDFDSPGNQFFAECHVPDSVEVTPEALNINGYSLSDIRNPMWRQPMLHAIRAFLDWTYTCDDRTMAGINIAFDRSFLGSWCSRYGIATGLSHRCVDLHSEVYAFFRRHRMKIPVDARKCSILNTDFIHPFVGLPEEPKPHHALNGARWECEALHRIWFGLPLLPEMQMYPVPTHLKGEVAQ
jgi:DNA polymerase III epsilon subunit-like protein